MYMAMYIYIYVYGDVYIYIYIYIMEVDWLSWNRPHKSPYLKYLRHTSDWPPLTQRLFPWYFLVPSLCPLSFWPHGPCLQVTVSSAKTRKWEGWSSYFARSSCQILYHIILPSAESTSFYIRLSSPCTTQACCQATLRFLNHDISAHQIYQAPCHGTSITIKRWQKPFPIGWIGWLYYCCFYHITPKWHISALDPCPARPSTPGFLLGKLSIPPGGSLLHPQPPRFGPDQPWDLCHLVVYCTYIFMYHIYIYVYITYYIYIILYVYIYIIFMYIYISHLFIKLQRQHLSAIPCATCSMLSLYNSTSSHFLGIVGISKKKLSASICQLQQVSITFPLEWSIMLCNTTWALELALVNLRSIRHTLDKKWSFIGSVGNWIPYMHNQNQS